MITRDVEVINRLGLHARAAAKFVHLAARFDSKIFVSRDSQEVSGKSILGLLLLAATVGTQLRISAEGQDENEAIQALSEFVSQRFGEKT